MIALLIAAGAVLGAATFWLRSSARWRELTGGGKRTGDAAWSLAMTLLALLAGLPWWWAGPFLLAVFLGGRLGWWGSLDYGTQNGTYAGDFALHSARGLFWTLPAGALLGAVGLPWASILGAPALAAWHAAPVPGWWMLAAVG